MPYVITEPCIGVKDASCVDVSHVDCIHSTAGEPQYYINPGQCIDCAACELACPVTAIYHEDALQGDARKFIEINANYYRQ